MTKYTERTENTFTRIGYEVVTYDDGDVYWYYDGKFHNESGPAVIHEDGEKCWFLNGVELTEKEFLERGNVKKKLVYTIAQFENVILFKIIEQDERFRHLEGLVQSYQSTTGVQVVSSGYPELKKDLGEFKVFLRGNEKDRDNNVAVYKCETAFEATMRIKVINAALKEWSENWEGFAENKQEQTPVVTPSIYSVTHEL